MSIWNDKNWTPMLLKEIAKPFDDDNYIFELKYDGIRAVVFASPEKVVVKTRNHKDISLIFPELQSIKNIVKEKTIFDGEIVSFQNNLPSFSKLQERNHLRNELKIMEQSKKNPIVFVCFDVLYANKDLTNLKLMERKKILNNYQDNNVFIVNKYINTNGKKLFKKIKQIGLEGIVAKRKESLYYINKRTDNWLKIKNLKVDKFIIGGYTDTNKNESITLYLGENKNNKLYFVGKVSLMKKNKLYSKILKSKILKKSNFCDFFQNNIKYISPKFTCEIKYLERTLNNHLRQPIFKKEI